MPKNNGANSKKGKGQSKRASYTVEQRFYVCHLKTSGKSPKEIGTLLKEKYGLDLQSSTLSTFYNKKNMKKYEKECHRYSLMASGETSINKIRKIYTPVHGRLRYTLEWVTQRYKSTRKRRRYIKPVPLCNSVTER